MSTNLKIVISDWQKVRFDEIATVVSDRIDKPIESGLRYYIGLEHLDTDCIRIKRFGSTEDVEATKFLCKKGDIIFGKRNAYLRKVAISDREAVVSAHSMVLRPTGNKIYPDFLPCFMQSSIFWKTAHSISEGSMSPTIKWKTLAAQEFWLPNVEEQKTISEILWSIEDNIQKTEKLIETTEKLYQELLNKLMTKGIGHSRFKDSEFGTIPEEWKTSKLEDLTTKIVDGVHKKPDYSDKGIPFITVKNLTSSSGIDFEDVNYITEDQHLEYVKRANPERGDILVTKDGTLGVVRIVDTDKIFGIFVSVALLKPNYKKINNRYLRYALEASVIKKQFGLSAAGSALKHIHLRDFRKTDCLVPPLEEQNEIVKSLEKFQFLTTQYEKQLKRLIDLKKKITNEIIYGKLKI